LWVIRNGSALSFKLLPTSENDGEDRLAAMWTGRGFARENGFPLSYVSSSGLPYVAPYDLRRTTLKLSRAAGGELEQIRLLVGHCSIQTMGPYLGTKQDLVHAPMTRSS